MPLYTITCRDGFVRSLGDITLDEARARLKRDDECGCAPHQLEELTPPIDITTGLHLKTGADGKIVRDDAKAH